MAENPFHERAKSRRRAPPLAPSTPVVAEVVQPLEQPSAPPVTHPPRMSTSARSRPPADYSEFSGGGSMILFVFFLIGTALAIAPWFLEDLASGTKVLLSVIGTATTASVPTIETIR